MDSPVPSKMVGAEDVSNAHPSTPNRPQSQKSITSPELSAAKGDPHKQTTMSDEGHWKHEVREGKSIG